MLILKRHIAFTIILATLMVLFVLIGLHLFIAFIGQLESVGRGDYGLLQVAQYIFLTLPLKSYEFFPMASLLGCLLGLGYLATHNELIVMRAAGLSLLQITHAVFLAATVMLMIMFIVGEVVGPEAMRIGERIKSTAESGGKTLRTAHGLWLKDGRDFIYIKTIIPGGSLRNISIYTFNSAYRLIQNSYAEEAIYQEGSWWLHNVVETHFSEKRTISKQAREKIWPIEADDSLLKAVNVDSNSLSILDLYQLIRYQKLNGLHVGEYDLKFWQRVLQPLAALVMVFLAIPFVFGPLRSVSMGLRILLGCIVGFSFYLLSQFIGPISAVYQIPAWLSGMFPILIFFGIGCFFVRRVN